MLTPYELAASKLCPAIRAIIANKLIRRHRLTQHQAARRLGLTQQAISNYSLGLRGIAKELRNMKSVDQLTENIVGAVLNGKDDVRITLMLSEACDYILSNRVVCKEVKPSVHCPLCNQKSEECVIGTWAKVKDWNQT